MQACLARLGHLTRPRTLIRAVKFETGNKINIKILDETPHAHLYPHKEKR